MKKIFLTILLFILMSGVCQAMSNVTFAWDANTDIIVGYRLYQSQISGQYDIGDGNQVATIPVGTETTMISISGGTYFWVVTAYNSDGLESVTSNEVTGRWVYSSIKPKKFTPVSTLAIWIENGACLIPGDHIRATNDNSFGSVDLRTYHGTVENPIVIDGCGFVESGRIKTGDNYKIKNVKFIR